MMSRFLQFLGFLGFLVASVVPLQGAEYTVTDLGTLGGRDLSSCSVAINGNGEVVGDSSYTEFLSPPQIRTVSHSFVYDGTKLVSLGNLGGDGTSQAAGLNNRGQVVGTSNNLPFIFSNGVMTDLGSGTGTVPTTINNLGQVVGYYAKNTSPSTQMAFLYDGGVRTDIGSSFESSSAVAINDSGQILLNGQYSASGYEKGYLYCNGTLTDIGTLGGGGTLAKAMNANGDVVGLSDNGSGGNVAFIYHAGSMRSIGNFEPFALNDNGVVVGRSGDGAVIFDNGVISDLNSLIPSDSCFSLGLANGINNSGQIVASGIINGETHAFLLSPVPEPPAISSLIIVVVGLACFITRGRLGNNRLFANLMG